MDQEISEAIVERLDVLIATLQLAHAGNIAAQRQELTADPINAAILEIAEEWVPAGDLTRSVSARTGAGERTVRQRVSDLTSKRLLKRSGAGPATQYKSAGVL